MTRLIDADALITAVLKNAIDYAVLYGDSEMHRLLVQVIAHQPTIDIEPQWIPCSERLPEAPFGCLVTVEDEEPMTGALFPNLLPYFVGWDGEQWNDADGEQCPFEVLAWMPLPKPYKGDKE